jgi:hypothetical protein
MDKLNRTSKMLLGAGVLIIVVLIFVSVYAHRGQSSGSTGNATSTENATTSNEQALNNMATTTTSTASAPSSGVTHPRPPVTKPIVVVPPVVIKLITPVANDQWKIGASNSISWNPAGNFSGEIDLVDGTTHAFIGVIFSETGAQQTSYSWNTRQYALGRYSPLSKEVVPGSYAVSLKFDGNNLPTLISPTFTITN